MGGERIKHSETVVASVVASTVLSFQGIALICTWCSWCSSARVGLWRSLSPVCSRKTTHITKNLTCASRSNTSTSAKLGVNCDVLKRYVTHCAHKCGSKFEVSPQVTNLERLFIPIGADASQALSVLLQSSGMDADSKFETVMECEKKTST